MDPKAQFTAEQSGEGEFVRQDDAFRDWLSTDGSTRHPRACWALIVRQLKGLDDVVGVTVVDPIRDERGCAFRGGPGHTIDPVSGRYYHFTHGDKPGRAERD